MPSNQSESVMSKPKKRLTKKGMCGVIADNIYSANPTKEQIETSLQTLWQVAYEEGWNNLLSAQKKARHCKRSLIKKDWDEIRNHIEDVIHGGVVNKNK